MSVSGGGLPIKMLIDAVRSRNVYGNKRNTDNMTVEKSDIYGYMTWILPRVSRYDGHLTSNGTFMPALRRKIVELIGKDRVPEDCYTATSVRGAASRI
jgi:hypothetical protein